MGRVVGEVFMVCDVNVGGDCTGQGLDSIVDTSVLGCCEGKNSEEGTHSGMGMELGTECVLARASAGCGGIDQRVEQDR